MILANARILTLDRTNRVFDNGAVEILADGAIGRVGRFPAKGDDVADAGGRLLMPALINCHTHLYSTLARGIAIPGRAPRDFPEILKKLWWRLDSALNEDDVYYSALVGLIDSARNGVATLIDHHSSPNACAGSLDRIEQAFRDVGLRGALCYETSDRNGPRKADDSIRENLRFLEKKRDGLIGATFGLHASFTLKDRTLRRCAEAASAFHLHIAEDACDSGAVGRLAEAGILNERTLAAHCLHISADDIRVLAGHRVNVIHNPQSNCNNAVGAAKLSELIPAGVTVGLGSDGCSPRLWDELKTSLNVQKLCSGDPRTGYTATFLNNREIVRKLFGFDVGRVETGARADLILVDYFPPTPLTADNLSGHLLFGISNAPIDSLIVNGRYIVQNRQCVTVDERAIAEKASRQARSLWRRFEACTN